MNTVETQLFADDWDLAAESSLSEIAQLLNRHEFLLESNLAGQCAKHSARSIPACDRRQKLLPCCDSRLLQSQHIFVALKGEHFDGHKFLPQVIAAGAAAIVYQSQLTPEIDAAIQAAGIAAFRVCNGPQVLSLLSAHCFAYPSHDIEVIGVTGTDGKTSIAYLCYQILQRCQQQAVGLLSTFGLDFGTGLHPNPIHQTTPDSLIVQRTLARMRANACRYAVVEASSHGLSPKTARLLHVQFCAAIFSNLSPEHLDFHGSMETYAKDKARLFAALKPGAYAVWNAAETASEQLYAVSGQRQDLCHLGYLVDLPANTEKAKITGKLPNLDGQAIPYQQLLEAHNLQLCVNSSLFLLTVPPEKASYNCSIPIPSSVYVSNVLAALSVCRVLSGLSLEELLQSLHCNNHSAAHLIQQNPQQQKQNPLYFLNLSAPKGRMELLPSDAPFTIVLDYAHSPGAFARLLPEMKVLLQASAATATANLPARMFLLFGSGGQRDKQKRALQGALAARYADVIALCNEDPRNEPPMAILRDIQQGISESTSAGTFVEGSNLFLIPDRRAAMAQVFALALPGDLVLLLGKGHETSIILSNEKKLPWDERKVAEELLENLSGQSEFI